MSKSKHGRSSSTKSEKKAIKAREDAPEVTASVETPDMIEKTRVIGGEELEAAAGKRKKRTPKPRRYSKPVRLTAGIMASLLAVVGVLFIGADVYLWMLFGRVNYVGDDAGGGLEVSDSSEPAESRPADAVDFDPSAYANSALADIPVQGDTSEITNILLIGVDGKKYSGQRADTNIIVSINSRTKTVKLISLMRDMVVTIPGRDWDGDGMDDYAKFNAAFASGGFSLHSKMIEQNLRLKLDKYIAVNFDAFPKVIDAMGGTDVKLTGGEAERVPAAGSKIRYGGAGYVPMGTTDGTYHMDGYQTLQFARLRYYYADSDFTRTSNQRKLISQLMDKAKNMSIGQLNSVLFEALGVVSTNMSQSEFLGFSANALTYRTYKIDTSYRVPEDGAWYSLWGDAFGSGLGLVNPEETVLNLQDLIYGQ